MEHPRFKPHVIIICSPRAVLLMRKRPTTCCRRSPNRAYTTNSPFVSLVSNGAMGGAVGSGGALSVITMAKTAENATNASIANTARHILWLPVAKEALYKAKTAIDTVCVRVADGLAAITVIVGTRLLSADLKAFFTFNLILVVLWLLIGILIIRERKGRRKVWAERERIAICTDGSSGAPSP